MAFDRSRRIPGLVWVSAGLALILIWAAIPALVHGANVQMVLYVVAFYLVLRVALLRSI